MNRQSNTKEIANSDLVPQLDMMIRALWSSPVRNTLFRLSGALFLVIALTAYGQIRLNNWNQPFYDALSRHDLAQFLVQLGVFGLIAGALLVLNVVQRWLGETLKLRLRQGLGRDLIQNWMQPGRRHGREPRSTHARRCTPPHGAVRRSGCGSAAVLDSAGHFRERALVTVERLFLPRRGPAFFRSGLHGVGRHRVFGVGLPVELLGRPEPDRP